MNAFGSNPGAPTRKVSVARTFHACSSEFFFVVAALFCVILLWQLFPFLPGSPFPIILAVAAAMLGLGVALYLFRVHRRLSRGACVRGSVVAVEPYTSISFAEYFTIQFTYLDSSGSIVAERGEFHDSIPTSGDAIWLIIDPCDEARVAVWR